VPVHSVDLADLAATFVLKAGLAVTLELAVAALGRLATTPLLEKVVEVVNCKFGLFGKRTFRQ
jgi:hypothetical protein